MASFVADILKSISANTIGLLGLGLIVIFIINLTVNTLMGKRIRLPPGPLKLPFVGTLPFHEVSPSDLMKMGKKYGDIFTIYIGSARVVIINSYDVMKEALVDKYQDFSDRGGGWVVRNTNPKQHGIVQADHNQEMRQYRNESLSILRTLGFGKSVMETKIRAEVEELSRVFADKNGAPFDPGHILTIYVTNVMYSILFGERFDHTDEKVERVVKLCDEWLATGLKMMILDYFPFLRPLPSMKANYAKYLECLHNVIGFLNQEIKKHLDDHKPGMDSDFLHTLIDRHLDPETNKTDIDMDNLDFIARDFFIAGMETTATSLKWTLVMLINHPEVQQKAHDQLDDIVGRERVVRLTDRDKLHYIEAIIWEVQRFRTVTPLSIPKYVNRDTTLAGYDIPRDTRILQNLVAVHMNPDTWGDPENFRPERFLDENGVFVRNSHLIPFSIGKRQCLGEVLARQELFLFTSILLQKFRFEPGDDKSPINDEGTLGFTFAPQPFNIKAIPR